MLKENEYQLYIIPGVETRASVGKQGWLLPS